MISVPMAWSLCPWHALHGYSMVSMSMMWSPCLRHALRGCSLVSVSMAWSPCPCHALSVRRMLSVVCSPCPWCALHVRGVASVSMAWSPCLWRGLRVCGMVSVSMVWWCVRGVFSVSMAWSPCPCHGGLSMAWSPCPWHGVHVSSMVSMAAVWSLWPCLAFAASPLVYLPPTCRWMFSLVKIGLQSKSSHTAPGTDIDCTDLTPYGKFLEVTSWARGVHVLDSFDSHSPTTLQRGHTLSCFSLSIYLRAMCPQGVHRADPWGTKG